MRIAARWIGWGSLIVVTTTLVAMVVVNRPALWLDPPQRLSKADNEMVELLREIESQPAARMRVCGPVASSDPWGLLPRPTAAQRPRRLSGQLDCQVACRVSTGTETLAEISDAAQSCLACVLSTTSAIKSTFR